MAKKPMTKMLISVSIFFILVFGWYGVKKGMIWWYMSHYKQPPATVAATTAKEMQWQHYLSSVGNLVAVNGVDITAESPGVIEQINFESGQSVAKGDVLLVQKHDVEAANLKSLQAKLNLAKYNHARESKLYDKRFSSPAVLDARQAELQEAQSSVDAIEAQVKQKTITAPFSGRLGIKQVNLGEYLAPGKPIVTLQAFDPLNVLFNIPEQNLADVHLQQDVQVSVQTREGEKTIKGRITAINAKVDQQSGNVLIQAMIENPNQSFYPGMFCQVRVILPAISQAIVVPQTAVSYSLSGDYVYLVKRKDGDDVLHAYRQYVKVGERRKDQVVIQSGLKPGDQIVSAGQLKLQNGAAIKIDSTIE